MTTPVSNDADKPATNQGTNTNTKAKDKSATSEGGVKVRLLAQSWQLSVKDDNGDFKYLRYRQGDELEVTEEVFEALNGPDAFKPAFEKVEAEAGT